MRLDKYLSHLGYGSRKDVKRLIKKKAVKVNNEVIINSGLIIDLKKDLVELDNEIIKMQEEIVILLNKPSGYLSSRVNELYPSLLNLIDEPYNKYKINIAGRLDQDTTGLIILTNNNELLHKLTHPNQKLPKTYEVQLLHPSSEEKLLKLKDEGVMLTDPNKREYLAVATQIKFINDEKTKCEITITSGKYHQVKLMFKQIDNEVVKLKRISIGKIKLEDLKINEGEYKVIKLEDFKYDGNNK